MNTLIKSSLPIAIALSLVACGGSSNNSNNSARMSFDAENLPALGDDFRYEGWIIVDGSPVSTGIFNIDENGAAAPATFNLDLTEANAASTFVLTIEPFPDADPAPAATHILAGNIPDTVAGNRIVDIVTDHPGAFSSDFTDSAGTFIVATPTNGPTTANQGIWFLTPPVAPAGPTSSVTLPKLPAGWNYEGWVVGENGPITTGIFNTDANAGNDGDAVLISGADSDRAGSGAGRAEDGTLNDGPPFPGQDFITPPLVLTGLNAVITVEPFPDNSPAPFSMRPLAGPIPDISATTVVNHPLNQSLLGGFPSATVTIEF